ncbi:HAD-IC family P-type ATPase, partial [Micromonospora sp. DH15]|nr:HAD-IC family P-type ATPase [Micromonospora sp. DH15]
DLVRVEAGDVVPADLRLERANRLHLDESALTGESVPVSRDVGEEVAAGTVVTVGRGTGTVVRTGPASALGRISTLVSATRPGATPMQRRLAGLGRLLGLVAVGLSALVFGIGVLGGRPVVDMAITAVSLVAAALVDTIPDPATPTGLRPVGLVAVGDPLRAGAAEIARRFDAAGVRLLLVTGDHPATAAAIGGQLGLWRDGDPVVRGDDGDVTDAHPAARVYARTQPEQKLDIIAGLQAQGHVVAMTGDGVNDAPALRRADIGVAMGGGRVEARQA